MNKNAIKKFAIEARKKLIASVTDKAGMLGITPDHCNEAVTKGADFEVYQTAAGTEITLNRKQCEQRRKLVGQIHARGFEAVIEEVAYTWFNRICAIRFMEVNDYMYPVRVRVLSSEKEGKNEPDVLTMAPDIDWNFTDKEREYIIEAKMNNQLDDLFRMLFIKQCNLLHEVLPGLFEETEDYTEMLLNISFTNEDDVVRMLVDREKGIPEEDFNVNTLDEKGNPTGQVEIIGWLYQYYNTELKDDTFAKLKKNIKISKERIPAATQLFTPDWIVRYMVENSVGRIWIEHLRAGDPGVDEKAAAEKFGWKYYLPEAKQEESVNVKLAEIRTTYKDLKPEDITCIDPCMGSGHILIAMFDVLMDIYESAGYDKREAAFEIVEHNIHGLDIDKRAYQLAYFAVMMKGRGYNRRFLNSRDGVTPEPKVYAIDESNEINRNHLQFFGLSMEEKDREKAEQQIRYLLDTFVDAREYGSILNVEECDWELLEKFASDLQIEGQFSLDSLGSDETQFQIKKLIKVAVIISRKYDAVVTNPPYMEISSGSRLLVEYVNEHFIGGKTDMFAVFIERATEFAINEGFVGMITQPSLTSLVSFEKHRRKLFTEGAICNFIHMGRGIFGIDFGSVSFVYRNIYIKNYVGLFLKLYERTFQYLNPEDIRDIFLNAKANNNYRFNFEDYNTSVGIDTKSCKNGNRIIYYAKQDEFLCVPGIPFAYTMSKQMISAYCDGTLGDCFVTREGMATAGNDEFLRLWYEVSIDNIAFNCDSIQAAIDTRKRWFPYNKGGDYRKWYGNNDYVVDWENDGFRIKNNKDFLTGRVRSHNYNGEFAFKEGITWSSISAGDISIRWVEQGFLFDSKGAKGFAENEDKLFTILGFLNSSTAMCYLKVISPTMDFKVGDIVQLPLKKELFENDRIKKLVKRNIDLLEQDWNSNETSWGFVKFPIMYGHTLNENMALILSDNEKRRTELKENEELINEIVAEIYGLNEEISIAVAEEKLSIISKNFVITIKQFISYAVGCMFGRYSLDEEGLILAGQPLESHFYMATAPIAGTGVSGNPGPYHLTGEYYYKDENGELKKCSFSPDVDNIIPITDEEYFSDDIVSRFVEFVKTVYGEETLEENLQFIADGLGNKGNTSREVIRNYFLKDFYADHLKVYQKRPIYWLFDSGKQNGFKALIYMHRYDADTVGRVRTDYLHKAQKYVETAMQSAQYTIDNSTSASEKSKATKAVTKYTKQLAEMKIYDEAIAHVANQRIEIDLDDGVKVNYAKFQGVEVAQEGKKALKVDLLARI